jgi:hypothetical protein
MAATDDIQIDERVSRLVERGLERYGGGDLEGAVSEWKHALTLDPDNKRAADYVAYVEKHYEMTGMAAGEERVASSSVELDYPFGLEEMGLARPDDDLDDYESFEIIAPDSSAQAAAEAEAGANDVDSKFDPSDSVDDGWAFDDGWSSGGKDAAPETDEPVGGLEESPFDSVDSVDAVLASNVEPAETTDVGEEQPTLSRSGKDVLARGSVDEEGPTRNRLGLEDALASFDLGGQQDDSESETTAQRGPLELDELTLPGGAEDEDGLTAALSNDALDVIGRSPGSQENTNNEDTAELAGGGPTNNFDTMDLELMDVGSHRDDRARDEGEQGDPKISFAAAPSSAPTGSGVEDITSEHLGVAGRGLEEEKEEEKTVERASSTWSPPGKPTRKRPPTEDPGITTGSVQVDDVLLSFEDATRELGIRDMRLAPSSEQLEDTEDEEGSADIALPPLSTLEGDPGASILEELLKQAPDQNSDLRIRFIVQRMLDRAVRDFADGKVADAASIGATALEVHSDSAVAQKLIQENREALVRILCDSLGDLSLSPRLATPLEEIPVADIDHRAAFLLTRIDGQLTFEDILDVSGMPRLETLAHLFRLHSRGYLEVR